jgi:hypothetical protein
MKERKYLMILKAGTGLLFIVLMPILHQSSNSQVVVDKYRKMDMEGKRLIITPISIDSMDSELEHQYFMKDSLNQSFLPVNLKKDSLAKLLHSSVTPLFRKNSQVSRAYSSVYDGEPQLVDRTLPLDESDTIRMMLPTNGTRVKMVLKGINKMEPDFLLFIQIGSIEWKKVITSGSTRILERASTAWGYEFKRLRYAFWDNRSGEIAVFGQKSFWHEAHTTPIGGGKMYIKSITPAVIDEFLDPLIRHILSKTPFASPTMVLP